MLDFGPAFYNSYVKKTQIVYQQILSNDFKKSPLQQRFINFLENYQLRLPKYISTHIMLFHSIKQYLISVNQLLPIVFPNASVSGYLKPGFHMIATIAVIAAIAEKKKVLRSQRSQRSYGNHFPEIAATTIAEMELFLPQRSLSLRSLERDFLMIAMIAAIAELFFSAIALITAIVAIIWRPGSSYASVLKKKIRFNNYRTQ